MLLRKLALCAVAALLPATWSRAEPGAPNEPLRYSGMCDASAGVALDAATFMAADDERNTLQVYRLDRAGPPLHSIPWDRQLGIRPADEHPEADIEGATVLGGRIYWISSHGRSRKGKWRPNRHRFFAMTVVRTGEGITAKPFGKPCQMLVRHLVRDARMQELGLAKAYAAGIQEVKKLAPKREGLNIEGLSATADGKSLLIGFRNPLPDKKALLVPLHNPAAVLTQGAAPEFGDPIQLRLPAPPPDASIGLAIRSIEYWRRLGAYLIVAGPPDTQKTFALYRWSGADDEKPKLLARATAVVNGIENFTPEALLVDPARDKIQLLSDDGTLKVKVRSPAECQEGTFQDGACEAKYLLDDRRKTFGSVCYP